MIVGKNPKVDDIVVNVCKRKQVTNMEVLQALTRLSVTKCHPLNFSLEQYLELSMNDDELLEVTPNSLECVSVF